MKNNYHYIIGLFALLSFSSCSSEEHFFNLRGSVKDMPPQSAVVLEELGFNETKLIDSTTSDKEGRFSLKGIYGEPGLYRLKMGPQEILVVIDGEKIDLKSDWAHLADYTAGGSPGSSTLAAFMKQYINANEEMLALEMVADSLSATSAPDSVIAMVQADLDSRSKAFRTYVKQLSDTTKSLPVAIYAVSKLLNDNSELEYMKTFAAGLSRRFADNQLSTEFKDKVRELASQEKTTGPRIGTTAPDFTLASLDGKQIALSAFRGKFVLIDFWASWCPPCRAENPNVVAAYEKYKSKNFTILGVSLDKDKDKWQEAVTKDKLGWNHVSDLQGWESTVAALYGVQSIPANFLLDPSGKIIATDLRGDELERVLASKLNGENLAQK